MHISICIVNLYKDAYKREHDIQGRIEYKVVIIDKNGHCALLECSSALYCTTV